MWRPALFRAKFTLRRVRRAVAASWALTVALAAASQIVIPALGGRYR